MTEREQAIRAFRAILLALAGGMVLWTAVIWGVFNLIATAK